MPHVSVTSSEQPKYKIHVIYALLEQNKFFLNNMYLMSVKYFNLLKLSKTTFKDYYSFMRNISYVLIRILHLKRNAIMQMVALDLREKDTIVTRAQQKNKIRMILWSNF